MWVQEKLPLSSRRRAIYCETPEPVLGEAEGVGVAGPLPASGASRPTSAGESPEASSTP